MKNNNCDYRVLAARYGEEVGRLREGGRTGSAWWREIVRIRDEESDVGERGWFAASIERRVGNGVDTFFWTDPWLGGVPLSVKYRRLFDLSLNKHRTVAEMRELGWAGGGAACLLSQINGGGGMTRMEVIPCGGPTCCSPVRILWQRMHRRI
ncbi:hypothetical protein TSUD_213200 [Trifolium subterraneum]|uniref:Reverse transcriptase zinc-binding domain-containing protein n=1 Tax=Trifolium subterraneum TaxID=3900 RepID=A0A2Z6P1Q3_TRISU|nr:hypothetical protein TSUD_213200 [Trifolium subterraneum]